jgi:hypothetical protein
MAEILLINGERQMTVRFNGRHFVKKGSRPVVSQVK